MQRCKQVLCAPGCAIPESIVITLSAQLTLYQRLDCHLCEDMFETLQAFSEALEFTVNRVDIDKNETLYQRYNTKVPVLTLTFKDAGQREMEEQEICHYFLDKVALCKALGKLI